jgi:hypothetical protein
LWGFNLLPYFFMEKVAGYREAGWGWLEVKNYGSENFSVKHFPLPLPSQNRG